MSTSISTSIVALFASVFVVFVVANWLFKVIRATLFAALLLAVVAVVLAFFFGIEPQTLVAEIQKLPQVFQEVVLDQLGRFSS